MAFKGWFAGKKTNGPVSSFLMQAVTSRAMVWLETEHFQTQTTCLSLEGDVLYLANSLDRETILRHLRRVELALRFLLEGQSFAGKGLLVGMGLFQGRPVLKVKHLGAIEKKEPRKALRISTLGIRSEVSFATPDLAHILNANLMDISMGGAGIRPFHVQQNWERLSLQVNSQLRLDIRLQEDCVIQTNALIRYLDARKMGLAFDRLDRVVQRQLQRFIHEMRRRESDVVSVPQVMLPALPPKETKKDRALVFGEEDDVFLRLQAVLKHRFDVVRLPQRLSMVRGIFLQEKPVVALIIAEDMDRDRFAQWNRLRQARPQGVKMLFVALRMDNSFLEGKSDGDELITLQGKSTLSVYREICEKSGLDPS